MTVRLDNVKLRIGESEKKLTEIAQKRLKKPLKSFKILKKSLDARDKGNIFWVYSIAFSDEEEPAKAPLERLENPPPVAVVGSGPAGLMCALRLIERGFKPIIFERGEAVEERSLTCEKFFSQRILDTESNVQFGEGGAGAFSDGKLNTQTHGGYNRDVTDYFVRFGAPGEISYLNKPHIGSDNLRRVLQNIRKFIEKNGGEYRFNCKLSGIEKKNGELKSLVFTDVKRGGETAVQTSCAVLAIGHSARDTFRALEGWGVAMTPREFALGVRVEHLASEINFAQYGKSGALLPAADYKLVSHAHERTVFTFCMCPGGVVIPAASEEGGVAVNGMSLYARDGVNSNSALMVQMKAADFGGGLFGGMEFQREIERKAFAAGGGSYAAPVQLCGDFLKGRVSSRFGGVLPTYAAGTVFAPLGEVLPAVAAEALKAALPDLGRKLKGFDCHDALFTGVETRFSSPVRIERGESGESLSLKGLYPCGEGSGYSGGIASSAADGVRTAEKIYEKFKNR